MAKYLDYDGLLEFKNQLDNSLDDKVDKVTGKGLSTNDFTTDLKNKLDNIEAGATANEGTVTGITIGLTDYIPINGLITLPDYPTAFGASGTNHSSGLVPDPGATQGNTKFLREDGTWQTPPGGTTYESKGASSGGTEVSLVTTGEKYTWNNKLDTISDLSTIRSGASAGAIAYQKPQGGIPASDIASGVIPTSLPASDVSAWAKASTKPSYSYSEISGTPSSLPANGGNAATVNNHSVNTDVPSNAVFTDTTYTFAEGTTNGAFTVTPVNGTTQIVPIHGAISYTETTTGITNLDATLVSTALRKTALTLTAAEKTQVKANIGIPNITISTSEPTSSDGNDGDIWLVYEI